MCSIKSFDKGQQPGSPRQQPERVGRPLPVAVQIVLQFGFPPRLVTSTYRQLGAYDRSRRSAAGGEVSSDVKHGRDGRAVEDVSAVRLLQAVEARTTTELTPSSSWRNDWAAETAGAGVARDDLEDDSAPSHSPPDITGASPVSSIQELYPFDVDYTLTTSPNDASTSSTGHAVLSSAAVGLYTQLAPHEPSKASAATTSTTFHSDASILTPPCNAGGRSEAATFSPDGCGFHRAASAETKRRENASTVLSPANARTATHSAESLAATPLPVAPQQQRDTIAVTGAREGRRRVEKFRALKAENRRLRARNTCRQCRQRPVSLTLLPCGHFCFCHECGSSFASCPVCRKTILADVRTFVA